MRGEAGKHLLTKHTRHPIIDEDTCRALCDCGREHPIPSIRIVESAEAYKELADECSQDYSGQPVLLLDDENTHLAAGARISGFLGEVDVPFKTITLPAGPATTEELAQQIHDQSSGRRLIIAVGAGTINDLGRYVAEKEGIPYWCVPTAISMNGYTSSIVAVKVRGVKRTLPAHPPQCIYVDPEVIQSSPLRLRQAGFCDMLAKSVSDHDWRTESLLFHGTYCSLPSSIVREPEKKYIEHPERILQGDRETVLGLFEGLLYSGIAMSLAGSSAPASGGEHLISHFLDMREQITGTKPNLHGIQVGAGLVLSAACYQAMASLDRSDLKENAEKVFEADLRKIPSIWKELSGEVEKQFLNKRDRLMQFDSLLPVNWGELRKIFSEVSPPEYFLGLIRRTGLEMTLPSLGIAEDEFRLAATCARAIRDRITVLDLAAHTGVLEDAAERTIGILA